MKIKKLLSLTVVPTLVIASLTGCGTQTEAPSASEVTEAAPKEETKPAEEGKEQEKVVLKVLAGQSTTDAGVEDMIDEALAKKYPEITLEWECVDWGKDFQPKMQQYMQSGLPDIMIGKAQDVTTYGSQGLLGDLTGKEYISKVLDAALPGVTLDNKVYGLVYNALYQGVYYNKQIFKDNNIEIPKTQAELKAVIDKLNGLGITPFATHFVDTWSIGNITMQFAINDVFNKTPNWGDKLREGEATFTQSPEYRSAYEYNKLIFDNTWKDETFSLEQTEADARLVQGKAAMKVSGSWSIQNFLDVDEKFEFGIFPFPNQTGDSKLIFEPNITFMKSADSPYQDAIDKVFEVVTNDKELALEIYNYTKTASMLKDVTPTFTNPSQADIDKYASDGNIVDANTGNTQLQWGGFQEENAKDIAEWLQGNITIDDALKAADARKENSKP
ncbi:MAG: sugar transporter substrate-binding protein [Clostridia bacterium]|jgi:ABC-type glycerol-3-phosphate transport system substrate-binding protein|nr:sugar transporter substrate-binding protein [Clostridia bacterium]